MKHIDWNDFWSTFYQTLTRFFSANFIWNNIFYLQKVLLYDYSAKFGQKKILNLLNIFLLIRFNSNLAFVTYGIFVVI